jgi:hypothetical protein
MNCVIEKITKTEKRERNVKVIKSKSTGEAEHVTPLQEMYKNDQKI